MQVAIPESLTHDLERGNVNLLIGSGLSTAAGLPDWRTLLEHLSLSLDAEHRAYVHRLLSSDRLLDAAQIASAALGRVAIAQTLDRLLTTSRASVLHDHLWSIQPVLVFTTNFDTLLEQSYARVRRDVPHVIVGFQEPVDTLPSPSGRTIVKLHGDCQHPDSLILSRNSFLDVIPTVLTQRPSFLRELIRRPTIALGYSLRDPDLQLLLRWSSTELRGLSSPLYVVIPEPLAEELILMRSLGNIIPLTYPPTRSRHQALTAFVSRLATIAQSPHSGRDEKAFELALHRQVLLAITIRLHDLNNALMGFVPLLGVMRRRLGTEFPDALARIEEFLRLVEGAASSAVTTTEQVRRSARLVDSPAEPGSWNDARRLLRDDMRSGRLRNVRCTIASAGPEILSVRPDLFVLMVRIPLTNALDATGSVGTVSLRVARYRRADEAGICVTVSDTGPGVARHITPFRLGSTSKGAGHGSGLFLLRTLLETIGGSTSLRSSESGTVVTAYVPFVKVVRGHLSDVGKSVLRFPRALRVIVVDDDVITRASLSAFLEQANCQVSCFASARRMVASVRRRRHAPDCIVTDLVMPDGSGWDVVRAIRQRFPETGVVLISGVVSDPDVAAQARTVFLAKPFEFVSLMEAMLHVVDV